MSKTNIHKDNIITKSSPTIFALSLLLSACSQSEAPIPRSLSANLTESFNLSCKTCHQIPGNNAPQAHDIKSWKKKMEKGLNKLVENTMNGTGAMPAMGQCFECTKSDLEQMILYMASPKQKAGNQ